MQHVYTGISPTYCYSRGMHDLQCASPKPRSARRLDQHVVSAAQPSPCTSVVIGGAMGWNACTDQLALATLLVPACRSCVLREKTIYIQMLRAQANSGVCPQHAQAAMWRILGCTCTAAVLPHPSVPAESALGSCLHCCLTAVRVHAAELLFANCSQRYNGLDIRCYEVIQAY